MSDCTAITAGDATLRCPSLVASRWATRVLERTLTAQVKRLLAAGRRPGEFYRALTECVPRDTTVDLIVAEFIHQAGYWLSAPGKSSLLAEVETLAEHSAFAVGDTIPGWFDRWFSEQADPERALQAMLDAISEVHVTAADAEQERDDRPDDRVIPFASSRS